jgi:hypothetical protein
VPHRDEEGDVPAERAAHDVGPVELQMIKAAMSPAMSSALSGRSRPDRRAEE